MRSGVRIKVCGMREPANIEAVSSLAPDYLGFIFYERSSRFFDFSTELPSKADGLKYVGVFVNESSERILDIKERFSLDAIQLHGSESSQFCETIKSSGIDVIKAFGVDENFDFGSLSDYMSSCDYFLFDTKTNAYGGSGRSFNWQLLERYTLPKPYFLSGGLSLENISELNNITDERFFAADLNSRFEIAPAMKDVEKLAEALIILKNKERI